VQSNVGLKDAFIFKRFVTNWTAVRFLTSVHSHMSLESVRCTEWFSTLTADK
jgi:hypothetical protein